MSESLLSSQQTQVLASERSTVIHADLRSRTVIDLLGLSERLERAAMP